MKHYDNNPFYLEKLKKQTRKFYFYLYKGTHFNGVVSCYAVNKKAAVHELKKTLDEDEYLVFNKYE